jgi:hypothetical protein
VSLAATLKATGLNILRAAAFKIRKKRRKEAQRQNNPGLLNLILALKSPVVKFRDTLNLPTFTFFELIKLIEYKKGEYNVS